jgi:beta-lactamase regulating signal transducer with metallopeptidase domain
VHTVLWLSSLLLVLLGSGLALIILRRLSGWAGRRDLQFLILAAPLISLAVGLGGLHHFAHRACFMAAPSWDYTLGAALPLVMGLVALGAVSLATIRLVLMGWVVGRRGTPASAEVQALADRLADRLGAPRPPVRLCAYDRPLAITYGLWRPRVLLSTWMVAHLDARELEAVLAHELGHVARRDFLVISLATVLRDAFCYLPTSWAAYRQLQHEKELACDDLAVGVTRRPLALASALTKVWQHAVSGPRTGLAQPLIGIQAAIEGRIRRLLDASLLAARPPQARVVALSVGTAGLVGLLILQAATVAMVLAPMGCGPAAPLWRLL